MADIYIILTPVQDLLNTQTVSVTICDPARTKARNAAVFIG